MKVPREWVVGRRVPKGQGRSTWVAHAGDEEEAVRQVSLDFFLSHL